MGIKGKGNQKTVNEGHMEQLPSVQQTHTALAMGSKRALERRGTKEPTDPGVARIRQQGSLVSRTGERRRKIHVRDGMETQGGSF